MTDESLIFSAVSNPQRLKIVTHIASRGEVVFSDIMKKFDLASGSVGFHLKELSEAGLIEKKNGDSYVLTEMGSSLVSWLKSTGKKFRERREREELLEHTFEWQTIKAMKDPLSKVREFTKTGTPLEWLGGLILLIGVAMVALSAQPVLLDVLFASGCATAISGAVINYFSTRRVLETASHMGLMDIAAKRNTAAGKKP